VRIVREPDGVVTVGGAPGRGAWLCGPPSTGQCFERAVRRRALEHALRAPVSGEELAALREKLMETTEDGGERE